MNSKELLEQARESMNKQSELIDRIECAEKVVEMMGLYDLGLYVNGTYINSIIMPGTIDKIKAITVDAVKEFSNFKQVELEQLLGIKQKASEIIQKANTIPGFPPPASQETLDEIGKQMYQDLVEDKLAGILQEEAQKIENKQPIENEGSLGKYPPNKRQPRLSDNLLPDIKKMYVDEGKTNKEIAEVYKVKPSDVSNFIAKHKLNRRSYDKSIGGKPNPPKQPEETERP